MTTDTAYVRALASLHTHQRERGRAPSLDVRIPPSGTPALSLAREIGLPADSIEGIFLNNRIAGIDSFVMPGDRVAFVPAGTPASHPAFFGPFTNRE